MIYITLQQSFRLIRLSRKRAKDKPWITKCIKISIKVKHSLHKLSLRNNDPGAKAKYTRYKNLLRTGIKKSRVSLLPGTFRKYTNICLWSMEAPGTNNQLQQEKNTAILWIDH